MESATWKCPFQLDSVWANLLREELQKPYWESLVRFVREERAHYPVYPPKDQVFNAFNLTHYDQLKVVIVGQDPYHGPGQAHGLSFSVAKGVPIPPSLVNIYKELKQDVGFVSPGHGCLEHWATQGVLLLNATLTVREGQAKSHHGRGWEIFTDAVIKLLFCRSDPLVFILWGASAREKCRHAVQGVNRSPHLILTSPHPSPLSAHGGFFGNHHFSKANQFLVEHGKPPIDWQIPA